MPKGKKECLGKRLRGFTMDDSEQPYVIHSATKITLSPLAREMAKMHGMSEEALGRFLLQQHRLQQAGLTQKQGEN